MVICLNRGARGLHMVHLMPLPPHHLLLLLTYLLIVPVIYYGIGVHGDACDKLHKLSSLHNKLLRTLQKTPRDSHNDPLCRSFYIQGRNFTTKSGGDIRR